MQDKCCYKLCNVLINYINVHVFTAQPAGPGHRRIGYCRDDIIGDL